MNQVQRIKEKYDMDILLRAIAPRMKEKQEARQRKDAGKRAINNALAKHGVPLRVL